MDKVKMWTEKREKIFIGNTTTIRRRTKRHRHRKIFAMVRRIARQNKKLWRRIYRTKFGIKIIPPEI